MFRIAKAQQETSAEDMATALDEGDSSSEGVDQFLAQIRFFPTPPDIAAQILSLNQQFGDHVIAAELEDLSSTETAVSEEAMAVHSSWLNTVINRVSTILFHEEDKAEAVRVSEEERVSLFQKTVSEIVYDRLSLLSLSPHVREGGAFSLKEELGVRIAADLGLPAASRTEVPEELRLESQAVLLALACEFQRWLLEEWNGVYPTAWGEIRARETNQEPAATTVWLEPDAEAESQARVFGGAAAVG